MKEFGSDFHYLQNFVDSERTLEHFYPNALYYALGRHAIIDLYRKLAWKRLWVPEYYCYDVFESFKRNGLNLEIYRDYPMADDEKMLRSLSYQDGDALLRINYFGLRSWRSNEGIPVPVVEDHTHDLIGDWAEKSDAEWCVASLRKTLPLAEGGILWSPKGIIFPEKPKSTYVNEIHAFTRWNAMRKKTMYLDGVINDKQEFRRDMLSTEDAFNDLIVSALDSESVSFLKRFNIVKWYSGKNENWLVLTDIKSEIFVILNPEGLECNPFSLILLFNDESERNRCRKRLIEKNVYPALLWEVPDDYQDARDFSKRMLSLHCDSRYSIEDVIKLRSIITGC